MIILKDEEEGGPDKPQHVQAVNPGVNHALITTNTCVKQSSRKRETAATREYLVRFVIVFIVDPLF